MMSKFSLVSIHLHAKARKCLPCSMLKHDLKSTAAKAGACLVCERSYGGDHEHLVSKGIQVAS